MQAAYEVSFSEKSLLNPGISSNKKKIKLHFPLAFHLSSPLPSGTYTSTMVINLTQTHQFPSESPTHTTTHQSGKYERMIFFRLCGVILGFDAREDEEEILPKDGRLSFMVVVVVVLEEGV